MNSNESETSPHSSSGGVFLWLLALGLLVCGIALRSLYLEDLPAYIHNDEAATAIYITPPFFKDPPDSILWGQNNYGGHANFGAWLASLSIRAAGKTLWAIRVGAALCGILSIVLGGLFIRTWLGMRAMVFFLVAVVPFHLHVHYSRTGFIYIHAALFIALVAYLFGRFAQAPSRMRGFFLGLASGSALLVYSATHVIPAVVGGGVLAVLLSKKTRGYFGDAPVKRTLSVMTMIGCGVALSIGPFVYHAYKEGISSRFVDQSVFSSKFRPLLNFEYGDGISMVEIVARHMLATASFFWGGDVSGQYSLMRAPLELFSNSVVICGLGVLLYRCVRWDPIAIFIAGLGVSTVVGSGLMIEKNFSPHFVAFGLILPWLAALALETACRIARIRGSALPSVLAVTLFVPWAVWNYALYTSHDEGRRNLDTIILHLPIPRESVRKIVNYTPFATDLTESFYMLRYPNASVAKKGESPDLDVPASATALISSRSCPCLLILSDDSYAVVVNSLKSSQRVFKEFLFDRIGARMLYVE